MRVASRSACSASPALAGAPKRGRSARAGDATDLTATIYAAPTRGRSAAAAASSAASGLAASSLYQATLAVRARVARCRCDLFTGNAGLLDPQISVSEAQHLALSLLGGHLPRFGAK